MLTLAEGCVSGPGRWLDLCCVVSLPPTLPLAPWAWLCCGTRSQLAPPAPPSALQASPFLLDKAWGPADNNSGPGSETVSNYLLGDKERGLCIQAESVLKDMVLDKDFPFIAECTRWQRPWGKMSFYGETSLTLLGAIGAQFPSSTKAPRWLFPAGLCLAE